MQSIDKQYWKGKKVFVTGGTGFIGSHLVYALLDLGVNVLELVHTTKSTKKSTRKVYGDVLDVRTYLDEVKKFEPDIIFHLAAQPIVEIAGDGALSTIAVNTMGTANMLELATLFPDLKRFVFISTDKVYGNTPEIFYISHLDGSTHPYNASKHAADVLAQMYRNHYELPVTIIRNANVYGEGDFHFERIIPRTIQKLLSGESPVIRGDGSNLRDYVYVSDIVNGYIIAAQDPYFWKNPFVLLGADSPTSVKDVVETITDILGLDIQPYYERQLKGEIPHQHIVDNHFTEHNLKWRPLVSLEDGLKRTVEWYVDELS